MSKKILITENVSSAGVDFLRAKGYELKFLSAPDEEMMVREAADCDGMIVRILPITRRVLESAKKLKVVGKHGVGTDNIDKAAAKELGISVVNTPTANTRSVAEYTIALLLACARRIPMMAEHYRHGDAHTKDRVTCNEVGGSTLGLVGAGRIGSIVGKIASEGLGMNVIAYDPYLKKAPDGITLADSWDEVFKRSDYVSVHMPLTPETRHCIGAKEFEMMKPSAYIINCSRGPIIDEEALVQAIQNKQIRGAGLDVTEQEPASPDSPLFKMDDVILTAHNAATTKEAMDKMVLDAAQGVDDVLQGRTPKFSVI